LSDTGVNAETETRGAPFGRFHVRLALILGAVLFVDGYDLFNAAYVAPYIREEWGLNDPQIGLMLSLGIFGLAIGALLQAPIVNRFGLRKATAAGVLVLGAASFLLATTAHDFVTFCLFRVLLGISLGMLSPLAFVYVNQWAPAQRANLFATITFTLPFSLGGIAAGLAGLAIAPQFGWRGLYMLAALLALPIGLLCLFTLPESASRLIRLGRLDDLRRQLTALRPERSACYAAATSFTESADVATERPRFGQLLRPSFRRRTIGIWTASALSLLCLHGLSGWLPSILISQGAAISSAFGYGVLLMSMQIVGGGAFGWASDIFGRPRVMAVGFIGGAAALLGLSQLVGTNFTFVAVAAAGFFIFGTQAVMNNFTAMSYPPALRSTGTGAAVAFSRIGGIAGPLVIGWAQGAYGQIWFTLAILAAAQLAASIIIAGFARSRSAPQEQTA
jgi:AAHS family benzoate transporter-like MFS transporter/AAHS family 4-hydroxybenzoate transporter-like MFS transporter